jgi:nardilysin
LTLIAAVFAEGAGSLLSLLKERGWATGLSAGVGEGGYDHSSAGYMFSVNIWLTDSGIEHVSLWAFASFV